MLWIVKDTFGNLETWKNKLVFSMKNKKGAAFMPFLLFFTFLKVMKMQFCDVINMK